MNSYSRPYSLFQITLWLFAGLTSSLLVNMPEVLLPSFYVTKPTNVHRIWVTPDIRSLQTVVADHSFLETYFSLEGNSFTPASGHELNDNWLVCVYNVEKDGFVPNWSWAISDFCFRHWVVLENLDLVGFVVFQIDSVNNVHFEFRVVADALLVYVPRFFHLCLIKLNLNFLCLSIVINHFICTLLLALFQFRSRFHKLIYEFIKRNESVLVFIQHFVNIIYQRK